MDRILFIDRDGTLIVEPPDTHQVDSLGKLIFLPGVIKNLARIAGETDFRLVMVTNQDGLGTALFPEEKFWPPHQRMLEVLENSGVIFEEVLIDRSLPEQDAPTRKPRTGLVKKYLTPAYDLSRSYVIGDRLTDMTLALNMGVKGIWVRSGAITEDSSQLEARGLSGTVVLVTQNWDQIAQFLAKS